MIIETRGGGQVRYKDKIREDAMKLNPIDDAFFVKMAEDLR